MSTDMDNSLNGTSTGQSELSGEQKRQLSTTKQVAASDPKPATKRCENCDFELDGPFCGRCGQPEKSMIRFFGSVVMHFLDDIFGYDSRASRTFIPLLFRPGFLTCEYFRGKRVHYVPPIRLYFFVSILFFLLLGIVTDDSVKGLQQLQQGKSEQSVAYFNDKISEMSKKMNAEGYEPKVEDQTQLLLYQQKKQQAERELQQEANGQNAQQFNLNLMPEFEFLTAEQNKRVLAFSKQLSEKAKVAFEQDATPLIKQMLGVLPQIMFVLLPIFALLLKIIYIFSRRYYMEHLTVALHSHAFIFSVLMLMALLTELHEYLSPDHPVVLSALSHTTMALMFWVPIYLFMMQKKVYRQGGVMTFVKFSVIGLSYLVLLFLTTLVAFVWGLALT